MKLAEGLARSRIDHPKGRVDEVAVLGVLEAQHRAVGRESGPVEPGSFGSPQPRGLLGSIELLRRFVPHGGVDGESISVAHSHRIEARRLGKALVPPRREEIEERAALPAVEWLVEPASGLVAGLVLEPQDPVPVDRGSAGDHPNGVIGDPAPRAGGAVPRMDLPHPTLRRGEHEPVGKLRRPIREREVGRPEPPLPRGPIVEGHGRRSVPTPRPGEDVSVNVVSRGEVAEDLVHPGQALQRLLDIVPEADPEPLAQSEHVARDQQHGLLLADQVDQLR